MPKGASMGLAMGVVILYAVASAGLFLLKWKTFAGVPGHPEAEATERLAAALPAWADVVKWSLLVLALLYPAWAAATAGSLAVRHWRWPLIALAVVVLGEGLEPLVVHLRASRVSHLWWSHFGYALESQGHSTRHVLLWGGLETLIRALMLLGLGLALVGFAARVSRATGNPGLAFGLAAALVAVGFLVLQWFIYARELWPAATVLSAALTAVCWLVALGLWRGLPRGSTA